MARYQYSSAALKEMVGDDYSRKRKQKNNPKPVHKKKTTHPFIWQEALVYIACISLIAITLYSHITISANKTLLLEKRIAAQKELLLLQETNKTFESQLENHMDIYEIKEKAMKELGMHYPYEGQVIYYENVTHDYVRKVSQED